MNYPVLNDSSKKSAIDEAEAALRVIASLPAPQGLEDRLHARLRVATRRGRLLVWPGAFRPAGEWTRIAAAAAIVFVVAGGALGIYSHVEPGQPAKGIALPHVGGQGGFSEGGAVRRPQTLNGPLVTHSGTMKTQQAKVPVKALAKSVPEQAPGAKVTKSSKLAAVSGASEVQ